MKYALFLPVILHFCEVIGSQRALLQALSKRLIGRPQTTDDAPDRLVVVLETTRVTVVAGSELVSLLKQLLIL